MLVEPAYRSFAVSSYIGVLNALKYTMTIGTKEVAEHALLNPVGSYPSSYHAGFLISSRSFTERARPAAGAMLYVNTFRVHIVVPCNFHVFFGFEAFKQHMIRILLSRLYGNKCRTKSRPFCKVVGVVSVVYYE